MKIEKQEHKEQLRTEFAVFLVRNRFNLMSFTQRFNEKINIIELADRKTNENYKLLYNRLFHCVNIDLEFIQKLIDMIDKTHKVQIIRDKVIIGKPF